MMYLLWRDILMLKLCDILAEVSGIKIYSSITFLQLGTIGTIGIISELYSILFILNKLC